MVSPATADSISSLIVAKAKARIFHRPITIAFPNRRHRETLMPKDAPPQLVPGNYYSFEMFIEIAIGGKTYLGYPKLAIRDIGKTPPVIRWGSSPKLAWPNPAIPRAPWIDVPNKGLGGRTITSPEDVLGAEGMVGNKRCRFEQILEVGKNQVVFSLFCPQDQTRIAYGFSRDMFLSGK